MTIRASERSWPGVWVVSFTHTTVNSEPPSGRPHRSGSATVRLKYYAARPAPPAHPPRTSPSRVRKAPVPGVSAA
ncbi:hypothetical protein GCM10009864_66430 [Streptomyces lunalinharesii]|uniref:Uncharacterized protein n=1 Tax=Streptomyces lunalinharesii TaxID=333384 RepID=A0ABP6F9E3_9ACTN